MSMELMVKAMKTRVGNPARKLVLVKMADNANDFGECWPSYKHIADQCEMSRRSVIDHVNALCEAGLVRKEIRKGGPKGNSSNVYILQLSGGANSALPPGAEDSPPSANSALPPSAEFAPRTSHSFEPVNEPVVADATGVPLKRSKLECPVQDIVDLFNRLLPEMPQVVLVNKDRRAKVAARWNDSEVHRSLDFWKDYFATVRESPFLMGRVAGRDSQPFRCNFDWLIAPRNFVKVVEGNYHA